MKELMGDLSRGEFRHVYLLYGPENYLKLQYRDKLAKALLPEDGGMNFSYHYQTAELEEHDMELLYYYMMRILFTGDVEGAGEEALIRSLKRNSGTYAPAFELLKVAHHGSRFSTPEELLDLLHPAVSVISCGAGNRYGHPHAELLERLSASGTAVFRTDTCGAVTVMTDGHRFAVETFRQP